MSEAVVPLVAHIIYRLDIGGLENGVVNLVNRMPPHRYRHAIICTHGYSETFCKRIHRPDVLVVSVDKRPGKDPGAYYRVWRALRRLRPAIVHTRNLGTVDLQWVAAAAGIRRRIHGEHGWGAADVRGTSARSLRIRRACRRVIHTYVAMSRDLAQWLEQQVGVPHDRIRQLYSGVDTQRFSPEGALPADFPWQAATSSDERPFVIGTVGRLDPIKGQDRLLAGFRRLLDDAGTDGKRRLRLVIAGDGPARDSLLAQRSALGLDETVWMPGARGDIPQLMRAMDVFVLPSLNEGISNTILEAMASGRPVVAARVGGNPELVLDELTGSLYEAGGPESDAAGIATALQAYVANPDLCRRHGAGGRERALEEFSLDAMVQRYLNLYDELMGTVAN